jgi:hypothetical protein
MNNLYFACMTCKEFLNAGYRWAHFKLEVAGVVQRDHPVNVEAILAATEYWVPDGDWISRDIHPFVRTFLDAHRVHELRFGESESFQSPNDPDEQFEWLELGPGGAPEESGTELTYTLETPRCWITRLGFTSWDQVTTRVTEGLQPVWWFDLKTREAARHVFERRVKQAKT